MVCHCRFIRNILGMCLYYSSKHHFVSRCSKMEVTYNNLVNKVVCDPSNRECMMHHCTNCPWTNTLCKFLEDEFSDIDPDFQFHYSQWQTTDRASLVTVTSTCEEFKNTLISVINVITKHLFYVKLIFWEPRKNPWKQMKWLFSGILLKITSSATGNPKLPLE